jgi:hypothetical protein
MTFTENRVTQRPNRERRKPVNAAITLTFITSVLVLCVFGFGCAARVAGFVETEPSAAFDKEPTLVAVEPGIWVVRRYPTPIYHVDGYYWTSSSGHWYHSKTWDGAWVHAELSVVPVSIVHRDHSRYVYYDGHHGARVRSLPPGHRQTPGVRRGHTSEAPLPRSGVLSTITTRGNHRR